MDVTLTADADHNRGRQLKPSSRRSVSLFSSFTATSAAVLLRRIARREMRARSLEFVLQTLYDPSPCNDSQAPPASHLCHDLVGYFRFTSRMKNGIIQPAG